jgi:hypothetical protein
MTFEQPSAVDQLRGYLSQQGIETELKLNGRLYVLFSQEQFADRAKSDLLAKKVNSALVEFGKLTRQRTSHDAITEQVKKE